MYIVVFRKDMNSRMSDDEIFVNKDFMCLRVLGRYLLQVRGHQIMRNSSSQSAWMGLAVLLVGNTPNPSTRMCEEDRII
jgi:hypothetical protein